MRSKQYDYGHTSYLCYKQADDNPWHLHEQAVEYEDWHRGWLAAKRELMSDIFEEGYDAASCGEKESQCPYVNPSDEREAWMNGFHSSFASPNDDIPF